MNDPCTRCGQEKIRPHRCPPKWFVRLVDESQEDEKFIFSWIAARAAEKYVKSIIEADSIDPGVIWEVLIRREGDDYCVPYLVESSPEVVCNARIKKLEP